MSSPTAKKFDDEKKDRRQAFENAAATVAPPSADSWNLWSQVYSDRDMRMKLYCRDPAEKTPCVSNTLVVRNIPLDFPPKSVENLFAKFGSIARASFPAVLKHYQTRYSFVKYKEIRDAVQACKYFNGYKLRGQVLEVVHYDSAYKYCKIAERSKNMHLKYSTEENINGYVRQAHLQSECRTSKLKPNGATRPAPSYAQFSRAPQQNRSLDMAFNRSTIGIDTKDTFEPMPIPFDFWLNGGFVCGRSCPDVTPEPPTLHSDPSDEGDGIRLPAAALVDQKPTSLLVKSFINPKFAVPIPPGFTGFDPISPQSPQKTSVTTFAFSDPPKTAFCTAYADPSRTAFRAISADPPQQPAFATFGSTGRGHFNESSVAMGSMRPSCADGAAAPVFDGGGRGGGTGARVSFAPGHAVLQVPARGDEEEPEDGEDKMRRHIKSVDDIGLETDEGFIDWLRAKLNFTGPQHYTHPDLAKAWQKLPPSVRRRFDWMLGFLRATGTFTMVGPFVCLPEHAYWAKEMCIVAMLDHTAPFKEMWEPTHPCEISSVKQLVKYMRALLTHFGPLSVTDKKVQLLLQGLPEHLRCDPTYSPDGLCRILERNQQFVVDNDVYYLAKEHEHLVSRVRVVTITDSPRKCPKEGVMVNSCDAAF